MPSYETPARVRFPRSNIPGKQPAQLAPGSFAINWPDRKLYVGDPGGVPILFSAYLSDWETGNAYYPGDFAVKDGEIIRAINTVAPNLPFDPEDWEAYSVNAIARYSEPNATGLLSGGALSVVDDSLRVAAGSGVIIDAVQPLAATFTPVEWPQFDITIPLGTTDALTVSIDGNGVASFTPSASVTAAFRRANIILGYVRVEAPSTIVDAVSTPLPVSGTAESVRDYYTALGGPRIAAGLILGPHGADLQLKSSAGVIFAFGREWHTDLIDPNFTSVPAVDPISFTQHVRSGLRVASTGTSIDPTSYDNGGAAATVPDGKTTIQYVWMVSDGSAVEVQLGQTVYDSVSAAYSALGFDFAQLVRMPAARDRVMLGALIVQKDVASLQDATKAYVALPLADGTFARTYPLPDADLSLYYRLDGSLPLTGDMDANGNAILNAVLDGGTF